MVLIGYVAYIKGFKTGSAFLFALAALIKVSPVLFLIYFVIFLMDYRFLLSFFLWTVGMVLLSLLVVPFNFYMDYLFQVLPEIGKGTSNWLNQSIVKFIPPSQGWLAQGLSLAGFVLFGLFIWWLSMHTPSSKRIPGKNLGENYSISEIVFILNALVILIFSGKSWSMAYVWMILPAALLVTQLLESRPKTWYLLFNCLAIFLLISKVYGYPVLNSLNLLGSLLLSMLLIIRLTKVDWAFNETPQETLPKMSE
jgi:hypothetical protein